MRASSQNPEGRSPTFSPLPGADFQLAAPAAPAAPLEHWRFPSQPIWQCASCVTTPTKPFGKQTQATERRALDSTAHVDSTVVYCMSRVDVPGTQIWHRASCATMSSKALGNQTQATRRRALDSTAHVDSTVAPCLSRVDVPGTQIWHCASCATMSAKHLGTRRRPRGDGRWTAQHT